MHGVRYVAQLDHLGHVLNILACGAHVKARALQKTSCILLGGIVL